MDIFEQEYAQRGATASDQFEKLAAELDGANVINKVNPLGCDNQPGGTDAKSLEAGLRIVESRRAGRGKITRLVEEKHPSLRYSVDRDSSPIISSMRSPKMGDPNSAMRMKTAALEEVDPPVQDFSGGFADTIAKLGSEGQLRTLDGWRPIKIAESQDQYVANVGREARRLGGTLGAGAGGLLGAAAGGAIRGRKGALIGGAVGGAGGLLAGRAGLGAFAENKARKVPAGTRRAADRVNAMHDKYMAGSISKNRYEAAMNNFVEKHRK